MSGFHRLLAWRRRRDLILSDLMLGGTAAGEKCDDDQPNGAADERGKEGVMDAIKQDGVDVGQDARR